MMKRLMTIALLTLALDLCCSAVCRSDIYKFVDARGVIHLTNTPTSPQYRLVVKDGSSAVLRASLRSDDKRYDALIRDICRRYAVDTALVKAVIKAESDFDPHAVSRKGAQGLMQLMPEKSQELSVSNPFDPHQNLEGGISHLKALLEQFKGDRRLALAAYNAGANAVLQNNGIPPYEETQNYVRKVLDYVKHFQGR